MKTFWLGRQKFESIDFLQRKALLKMLDQHTEFVFGMEFHPVLTLGKRATSGKDVLVSDEQLQNQNIQTQWVDRGGFATIHSPGQLVVYPMINLKERQLGVRDFIRILLQTTEMTLKKYLINSQIRENPMGLYTDFGKIAFCGLRVEKGVVRHGISINVSNELDLFRSILSCGMKDSTLDRIENYHSNVSLPQLFEDWIKNFPLKISD